MSKLLAQGTIPDHYEREKYRSSGMPKDVEEGSKMRYVKNQMHAISLVNLSVGL